MGFIMHETNHQPAYPVKSAELLTTNPLTNQQVNFAQWLHTTQRGGLGYTLRLFTPPSETWPSPPLKHSVPASQALIHPNATQRWNLLAKKIAPYLKKKKPVVVIVPEKWLLKPLAAAVAEKLAHPPLIIHGGLKKSALRQAVNTIAQHAPLVIGTQKALFLPYPALGAIVLAEENYQTHKLWDQYPRLSNWHGVTQLAALHHAALYYMSSFPSVRLYGGIQTKKIKNSGRLPTKQTSVPVVQLISPTFAERQHKTILPQSLKSLLRSGLKKKRIGLVHTLAPLRAKKLRHALYVTFSRHTNLITGTPNEIAAHAPYDELVWLFPENILRYPDYRSREHAYTLLQRLSQLLPPGRPLHLFTHLPRQLEQELLVTPKQYFTEELKARQRLLYPPFAEVVRLTIAERTAKRSETAATKIRQQLEPAVAQAHSLIRGPLTSLINPVPTERHVIVRGPLVTLSTLYRDAKISRADLDPLRIL